MVVCYKDLTQQVYRVPTSHAKPAHLSLFVLVKCLLPSFSYLGPKLGLTCHFLSLSHPVTPHILSAVLSQHAQDLTTFHLLCLSPSFPLSISLPVHCLGSLLALLPPCLCIFSQYSQNGYFKNINRGTGRKLKEL